MSHLFKDKKISLSFNVVLIGFIILSLFIFGILNYSGNKFIYISFSIISNFLIFFSFRKNSIFFETFFGIIFMAWFLV